MACGSCFKCVRYNLLVILTFIGVISGVVVGVGVRSLGRPLTNRETMYLSFGGEIFLSMLKALVLPLIFSSIIAAFGAMNLHTSWKIGIRSLVYYGYSTATAVMLGVVLVIAIRPGYTTSLATGTPSSPILTQDVMMDLLRNMFPNNLVQSAFLMQRTVLIPPFPPDPSIPLEDWAFETQYSYSMNMLGTVTIALVFGVVFTTLGSELSKPLLDVFHSFSQAMVKLTGWVIWLSPLGVFFLVAGKVASVVDFKVIAGQLGMYVLTVMTGLFIHGGIMLPLFYIISTRSLPFRFILNMSQALITGFGTSSSNATLPVTLSCLEINNGIDRRLTRFIIPIGTLINMNGTALYEAVAVIFIAQMHQMSLSFGQIIAISLTATLASIAAAGIPSAGILTMVIVLGTVGLPASEVTYVLVIDWLLDRFRTVINILGDSIGAGIVAKLSSKELAAMDLGIA